jgi:hypothetical protein
MVIIFLIELLLNFALTREYFAGYLRAAGNSDNRSAGCGWIETEEGRAGAGAGVRDARQELTISL